MKYYEINQAFWDSPRRAGTPRIGFSTAQPPPHHHPHSVPQTCRLPGIPVVQDRSNCWPRAKWAWWFTSCIIRDMLRTYDVSYTCTYIHTLHYITLHYITLHYITLHYITLHTYIRNSICNSINSRTIWTQRAGSMISLVLEPAKWKIACYRKRNPQDRPAWTILWIVLLVISKKFEKKLATIWDHMINILLVHLWGCYIGYKQSCFHVWLRVVNLTESGSNPRKDWSAARTSK